MKKIIIFAIASIFFVFALVHYRTYSSHSKNDVTKNFIVAEGDDVVMIGQKLAQEDLIANRLYFYYYGNFWKLFFDLKNL